MLIHGEVEIDGNLHVRMSAYEMRMTAQSSHRDFSDLIIEVAQLDKSITDGVLKDREVRLALLLRTRGGYSEREIEDLLGSKRPGYALLARGADLLARYQRGQHNQLLRVRANQGLSDSPVCWRCLKEEVSRPGDWCGCLDKQPKSDRPKSGPSAPYDAARRPDVADLTEEERLAEIALLSETQAKGPIAGGEWYRKTVSPIGLTFYDEDDIRRSDRSHHRGTKGSGKAHGTDEQVPSARTA